MNMPDLPWTSEQREWLQALGHDVLMLAPAGSETAAATEPQQRAQFPETPRAAASPATARPVPASPLLRALARAAGRSEDDPEFVATVPDPTVLRGNPSARRALWPRLRALRKRTPR